MKTLLYLLIMSAVVIALVGCCKQDEQIVFPDPAAYANYFPLKVGNYWIYQRYLAHPDGTETIQSNIDSSFIEKDTIIRNETYYKLKRSGTGIATNFWILRDSLHYLIDSDGRVLFSSIDFTTVFRNHVMFEQNGVDTFLLIKHQMQDKDSMIHTPAGSFVTSSFTATYLYYPLDNNNKRFMHRRYAKDIGIVEETTGFYQSTPDYWARRLLRYKVD